MSLLSPHQAAFRFGFGFKPNLSAGEKAFYMKDIKAALLFELDSSPKLDAPTRNLSEIHAFLRNTRSEIDALRKNTPPSMMQAPAKENAMQTPNPTQMKIRDLQVALDSGVFKEGLERYHALAHKAPIGFYYRLMWFWVNHFAINSDKDGTVRTLTADFIKTAISQNMMGRFEDLVLASSKHPAMILYLDNQRSMGANSPAGTRQKAGLNENLAREIMELHTMGVRSGYTQQDVTAFANLITGWTLPNGGDLQRNEPFDFKYNPNMHEPREKIILNQRFGEGLYEGERAIRFFANHPTTAKFIATKLVTHFISDVPNPVLVQKLEKAFLNTQGNLKAVYKALIEAKESFETGQKKLKPPQEWLMCAQRALNILPEINRTQYLCSLMGQGFWKPPSPKGYSDDSAIWLSNLAMRLDITNLIARNAKEIDASQNYIPYFEKFFGESMNAETKQTMQRAETPLQALTIALLSPEMMMR